jgi:hypothetical protein
VYPLRTLSGKRGRNQDVAGAGGAFAEFDAQDFVEQAEAQPYYTPPAKQTASAIADAWGTARKRALTSSAAFFHEVLARVDAHIAALPVPPSAIVNSGGGRHCYWYFDRAVVFADADERAHFAAFLAAWVDYVGGDPGAKDLARVLRVPGSVNGKEKYIALFGAPLPVAFLAFDPTLRYALDDLVARLPAGWDAPAVERKTRQRRQFTGGRAATPTPTGDLPDTPEVRRYNARHKIEDELRRAGCAPAGGNRWIAPQSTSGQSSLIVSDNHAWAFSPKNPVGREGMIRPADIALQLDYGGNVAAFLDALRQESAFDFDKLYYFATFGDIEPLLRTRLAAIAKERRAKAEEAARLYADTPNDRTEAHALRAAKRAEQAEAKAAAPLSADHNRRRLMVALLDKFRNAGGDAVRCSTYELAARANMSRHTVITTLEELEEWFVIVERGEKRAPLMQLSPVLRKVPVFALDVTSVDLTSAKTGTLALHTHYDHDAMCTTITPRPDTPEERAKVGATANAIRYGLNASPDDSKDWGLSAEEAEARRHQLAAGYIYTQESRFAASIPSLGGRALMLITHLQALGGEASFAALAASMGIKANRLSELAGRLVHVGIAEKPDHYTLRLADGWAEVLDVKVKEMPTFGSKSIRTADWLNGAIAYQELRMQEAIAEGNAHPEEAEAIMHRVNAIQARLDELEGRRAELEAWAVENLPAHKQRRVQRRPGTPEDKERFERHVRMTRSAKRLAEQEEAIAAAKAAAMHREMGDKWLAKALQMAGYSPAAIAYALRNAYRYADAPALDPVQVRRWDGSAWVEVAA